MAGKYERVRVGIRINCSLKVNIQRNSCICIQFETTLEILTFRREQYLPL